MIAETKVRFRVVQWATGNVGSRAMRRVIEHPQLELVGLYVHSPAKEGRDAGELCGLPAVGVKATRSVDEIIALKPDCVVYMQESYDLDDVCRLLASGANIVTTRGEFINPRRMDSDVRERVERACQQGGSTIYATGSSPGFITEAMPLVLTSIQRRLDGITIDEFANLESRDSPAMLFQGMGYGQDPKVFDRSHMARGLEGFSDSFDVVADALGIFFESVEVSHEVAVARNDVHIVAGVIPKGTIAAHRIGIACMRGGRPLMQMRLNWYCTTDIDADWDLGDNGWRVQVAGDVPLDVRIKFPVAPEDYGAMTPGLTAHPPVNAIPYVCAAPPGIKTTVDLPRIIAHLA
jgi:4-hydroxy-tetrahydrodipicolinate reductase